MIEGAIPFLKAETCNFWQDRKIGYMNLWLDQRNVPGSNMSLDAINKLIARYQLESLDNVKRIELAESIFNKILDLKICPNPIHFTILYESVRPIDPSLAKRIQETIDSNYYNDDTANNFFNELIAKYLYQNLPTKQVEALLLNLLKEIEQWHSNAKQNKQIIIKSFSDIEDQLPETLKTTLKEEMLPAINSLLEDTAQLQNKANEASNEITQLKMELDQANTITKTYDNITFLCQIETTIMSAVNMNLPHFHAKYSPANL